MIDLEETASPRFVSWLVPSVAGVLTVIGHIATANAVGFGLFRDELYFLACGEHLAFGYVDQPPGIALIAALARGLFGDSVTGLRVLPALAGGGTAALAALLARELGGSRWAEVLTAVAVALAPIYIAMFGVLTMNAFDYLLWAAACLVLAHLMRTGEERLWLVFGVVAGIGLENKLSMAFLGIGVAVGLVVTRFGRAELRRPYVWAAALLALVLFAPYVVWQYAHGWPLRELIAATAGKNYPWKPAGYIAAQIFMVGPLSTLIWLGGAAWLFLAPSAKRFRALGWVMVVVIAVLLSSPYSKAYYLAPLHVLPLAAGSVALAGLLETRRWGWLVPTTTALVFISELALAPMAKPILPLETFVGYQQRLGVKPSTGERQALGRLPQFFADRLGWVELVETVAQVHQSLPPAERAVACIYVENYGEAGAVDFYGPERGLPKALSGHNNYWIWGPGGCSGEVMIVLAAERKRLDETFTTVTEAGTSSCGDCMPYENGKRVYIARGLKQPLIELWPALKTIN